MNTQHEISRLLRITALAVSFLGVTGLASANASNHGADVQLSKIVNYSDLNLSNPTGISRLYSRLQSASRDVCAPLDERGSQIKFQACQKDAMQKAVADISVPALTSYYNAKVGLPPTRVASAD